MGGIEVLTTSEHLGKILGLRGATVVGDRRTFCCDAKLKALVTCPCPILALFQGVILGLGLILALLRTFRYRLITVRGYF